MILDNYKDYSLCYYEGRNGRADRLQTFKPRLYDDQDYYFAYTEDTKKPEDNIPREWTIQYNRRKVKTLRGTFAAAVEWIDGKNRLIKPRMLYN